MSSVIIKAHKQFNLSPINICQLPSLIYQISKLVDIPVKELYPIGSTSKKNQSNDIDLCVDNSKFNSTSIHSNINKKIGEDRCFFNHGANIGSYVLEHESNFYQFDLMFSNNLQWSNFIFSSPIEGQSNFKGAIRNLYLSAITKHSLQPGDGFMYVEDELVVRVGPILDVHVGCKRSFKLRKRRKDSGFVKNFITVSPELIKDEYPAFEFDANTQYIIQDPSEYTKLLFGDGINIQQLDTFESVYELAKSKFSIDKLLLINNTALEHFEHVKHKMNCPLL